VIGMLAGLCLRTGDSIRADGLLEELKTRVHPDLVWFGFVWFHSVCSEFDKAADSLEKAIEARDPSTFFVGWLPLFADFRHSRRWPELAKQLNLPASQQ
jgi:hypothetical protein